MPRQPRVQFPGAFYHVMSRGNNKQDIFLSTDDRFDFLDKLAKVVDIFSWVCHAYCLMENHYHLLINTPLANLSEGMHCLNSAYCNGFNRKYGRVGHVMQGRFQSPLVKNDGHLLELSRYIALNPVRSSFVREPGQWRWSSYKAMIGLVPVPRFLEVNYILDFFSEDPSRAREAYTHFVAEGNNEESSTDESDRVSLRALFQGVEDRHDRNRVIRIARRDHGYTPAEIAVYLNMSHSTVCKALKE